MGDNLVAANHSNPKGHFENLEFQIMNEKILDFVGAKWSNPPSREKIASCYFPTKEIYSFLATHTKPIWGLKDPRTTLTFDMWKPYFEEIANITYIFVWRSLEESICSLASRDKMDLTAARRILECYLINLQSYREELEKENKDIIDIHFNDLLNEPEVFVKQINLRLNQNQDQNLNVVKQFLDRKLKHF